MVNGTTGAHTLTIKSTNVDAGFGIPQAAYLSILSNSTSTVPTNNSAGLVAQFGYTPVNPANPVTFASTATFSSTLTANSTATFNSTTTVPTVSTGDNTTNAANTSFVQTTLGVTPTNPAGRLTLTTLTPVLSATVTAATSVYYTPYQGAGVPLWNGTIFVNTPFAEISQLLSDTTKSPAAAVAASVYDLFVWNDSGTVRLSRGPVWTNVTTRSTGTAVARVSGILVNSIAITNGPAAGYGTYVGTIATDAGGATVTFNPWPAAASGGPTGGSWIGLWNQYNRQALSPIVQDNKASWAYTTSTWRQADASTANQITFVTGQLEDNVLAVYTCQGFSVQASGGLEIGLVLDAVGTPVVSAMFPEAGVTTGIYASAAVQYSGPPVLGKRIIIPVEWSSNSSGAYKGVSNYSGAPSMQLSAQLRF